MIEDGNGAAFLSHHRHVILGLHGETHENAHYDKDTLGESTAGVRHLQKGCGGLTAISKKEGFTGFYSPKNLDPMSSFGLNDPQRLSHLKAKLDPNKIFNKAFPRLIVISKAYKKNFKYIP